MTTTLLRDLPAPSLPGLHFGEGFSFTGVRRAAWVRAEVPLISSEVFSPPFTAASCPQALHVEVPFRSFAFTRLKPPIERPLAQACVL